jgi:hypothetical protein
LKSEAIQAADGMKLAVPVYEPDSPDRGSGADLGVRRLVHFGPFRCEHEAKLWPRMAELLSGLLAPKAA